ncbi:hypothetical protein ScPMuIL_001477 [Solemya velum]
MKITLKRLAANGQEKNNDLKIRKRRTWGQNRKGRASTERNLKDMIVNVKLVHELIQESRYVEMALWREIRLHNAREMKLRLEATEQSQSMELPEESVKLQEPIGLHVHKELYGASNELEEQFLDKEDEEVNHGLTNYMRNKILD